MKFDHNTSGVLSTVIGHFDGVFGRLAIGWAYDTADSHRAVTVDIICEGRIVASTSATHYRSDLEREGIGNGFHQFKCLLPIELFDGVPKEIQVMVGGTVMGLAGGPHAINQKLATLGDAFDRAAIAAGPAMSDFQVAVLRSLTTACETLSEHSKILQKLSSIPTIKDPTVAEPAPPAPILVGEVKKTNALVEDFRSYGKEMNDVIVFSIIDWNFRVQRPQHMAANFAKLGSRVTYVSVHLGALSRADEKFELTGKPDQGVYEVTLRCTPPVPSVYSGFVEPQQVHELCLAVDQMLETLGIKSPTVVLHYPTWLPVATSIPGATLVFDCLDHLAGFSTASPEVIEMEDNLIRNADAVVTSSEYLRAMVGKTRSAPIIRNAAEIEFFSTPPLNVMNFGKGPVIGYYGAIAEWFDTDLVFSAAKKRPDWQFVLVGSTAGAETAKLEALPNVHFTGEVPYREIPSYLYSFDCCLIPFKLTELIKATNPVKIYEYFAAGKPVVATQIPELKLLPQKLLRLAKNKTEFVTAIEAALKEPKNLKAERRLWVMDHNWMRRSRDFLDYVRESTPRVSVVVLCYNNLILTKACVDSIERFSNYSNLELVCVDNNSTDGTVEFLREWSSSRPWVKFVANKANLGFAAGNNVGIENSTGDYIVLLNNDTYVTEGWVRDLIRPLVRDPNLGLSGPVTNMIGNEQKINIHYSNMEEMARAARNFTMTRKADLYKTDNLAFFCVAIPRPVIEAVGLLDTQFGLGYFEDDDYCRRVAAAGYELSVVDGVFVHHHLSGSFDQNPTVKQELLSKNKRKFEAKWGVWTPHQYRDAPGFGG